MFRTNGGDNACKAQINPSSEEGGTDGQTYDLDEKRVLAEVSLSVTAVLTFALSCTHFVEHVLVCQYTSKITDNLEGATRNHCDGEAHPSLPYDTLHQKKKHRQSKEGSKSGIGAEGGSIFPVRILHRAVIGWMVALNIIVPDHHG